MKSPENMVPIPEWYGREALPTLKLMWRSYVKERTKVDAEQSEYYNSVLKFEKVKKDVSSHEMPFGDFLFAFFGFKIEYQDGIPCVSEVALQRIKEVIARTSPGSTLPIHQE